MRKNENIDFTKKTKKHSAWLPAFLLCIAVLLAGGSVFVFLLAENDFSFEKLLGTRQQSTESTNETEATDSESLTANENTFFSDEDALNILFLCHDAQKNITFCTVTSCSFRENVIRVKPVSTLLNTAYNGSEYSLNDLFGHFSVDAVLAALKAKGIEISRYIVVSETSFKMLMQRLGAVTVQVPNDIKYRVDAITYSLQKGDHLFTADALLKYMKYGASGDDGIELQGNAFASIIATHFTAENLQKGDGFFAELINMTKSNISAFDYMNNRDRLTDFLNASPAIRVVC